MCRVTEWLGGVADLWNLSLCAGSVLERVQPSEGIQTPGLAQLTTQL